MTHDEARVMFDDLAQKYPNARNVLEALRNINCYDIRDAEEMDMYATELERAVYDCAEAYRAEMEPPCQATIEHERQEQEMYQ